MLDLGQTARRVFAIAFFAVQAALIFTADLRADRSFAFRMFNESSSFKFGLFRVVPKRRSEKLVPVSDGTWSARGADGVTREFRWADRVRHGSLFPSQRFAHSAYGLDAGLFRLQHALDDVAKHTPDDVETRRLVAIVETVRNGRPAGTVELSSAPRGEAP